MSTILKPYWRWIPALLWMGLIFYMSHQPGGESGELNRIVLDFLASIGLDLRAWFGEHAFLVVRKTAHFTEYFILFCLLGIAMRPFAQFRYWQLGLTVVYAASDEFHQLFIPGRVGDITDVLIDSAGALFAFLLFSLVLAWRRRKAQRVSASSQAR